MSWLLRCLRNRWQTPDLLDMVHRSCNRSEIHTLSLCFNELNRRGSIITLSGKLFQACKTLVKTFHLADYCSRHLLALANAMGSYYYRGGF